MTDGCAAGGHLRKYAVLLALLLVVVATVALPRVAEFVVGPLSFGTRALAGVGIAVAGGIALYLLYNSSARNEP